MPTRRILLMEIIEKTPEEGDTVSSVQYEIRVTPRWATTMTLADRGIVSILLAQFNEYLLHTNPVYIVAMQPYESEVEGAIERIEAEGVETANPQLRAIDLEALIRAARAGMEGMR